MSKTTNKYSPEVRERAVRLAYDMVARIMIGRLDRMGLEDEFSEIAKLALPESAD